MDTTSEKKIRVLPNGPYEVTGSVALDQQRFVSDPEGASIAYEEVRRFPAEPTYHLCRCGRSEKKPFCDGSHVGHFDGTETAGHAAYDEMARLIEGKQVDLMDAEPLCAIARFCDTYGTTWKLVADNADPAALDILQYQCAQCPSGRLTLVTKEGRRLEPALAQEISVLEDLSARVHGPIWVKGGLPVEDAGGEAYPIRNRVTLCRCGRSRNKPFCDGEHMKNEGEITL